MNIYLDVELTDWHGDLISIGMISSSNQSFYVEIDHGPASDWVVDNVYPKLKGNQVSRQAAALLLNDYLSQFDECTIVADWAQDIAALCGLFTSAYKSIVNHKNISFKIVDVIVPLDEGSHNAMYDAAALKALYDN